ncbi:MAG: type II toxin-antitoxin system Phd/YefM family antitoxin [Fibrobacteres bacterium]|nr:type II toxin-antitoxin system Phd/YefM family antitoxin [Fibrobacterota bacterium]
MKLAESVKPVSYLKSHAADILKTIADTQTTYVITQNGSAKAVIQDINTYEQQKESIALLRILAGSTKSLKAGKHKPYKEVFKKYGI